MRSRTVVTACLAAALLVAAAPAAWAPHFYRGPGGGCTPADGELSNGGTGQVAATVLMLHNSFNDAATGLPVTVVNAGQAIRWTWNSEHCHSATSTAAGGDINSGFHYPSDEPTTPSLAPGVFHYPVPTMTPTLAYTHTFTTPGVFTYNCVHHNVLGMVGVVVVN